MTDEQAKELGRLMTSAMDQARKAMASLHVLVWQGGLLTARLEEFEAGIGGLYSDAGYPYGDTPEGLQRWLDEMGVSDE